MRQSGSRFAGPFVLMLGSRVAGRPDASGRASGRRAAEGLERRQGRGRQRSAPFLPNGEVSARRSGLSPHGRRLFAEAHGQ